MIREIDVDVFATEAICPNCKDIIDLERDDEDDIGLGDSIQCECPNCKMKIIYRLTALE